MKSLQQTTIGLAQAFNASSIRQRIIVTAALFIATHAIWDTLIHQPQVDKLAAIELSLQREKEQISQRRNQRVTIDTTRIDRNMEEAAAIKQQIAQLDRQINQASSELIAPDQMPEVLHELFTTNGKLKVTSLSTTPAEIVDLESTLENGTKSESPVYRHSVTLGFEGDYLSTLAYIRDVEKLGWRIFWDSVRIDSSDYPVSRVSISVYTLSLEEGWIGV